MTKTPWKLSGTGHVVGEGRVVCDGTSEEDARRIVACVNACEGIPTEVLETAVSDKTHGCHVDLEDWQKPDDCVMDHDAHQDCVYAMQLQRDGKTKLHCEYWRPIALQFRLPKASH